MPASRYDKYVVRKPAIVTADYRDEIPDTDKIPISSPVDTGPRVIFSPDRIPEGNSIIEYGIISGDVTIGDGFITEPHKHDYAEIFLFLGTDPSDTTVLGAEVEFWLGEGADRDKVIINTSSSIYVPPGLAHFPQFWRNVVRPVMTIVVMPDARKRVLKPVSLSS
jgi:uncharacterized RmlC-like cupin family protein